MINPRELSAFYPICAVVSFRAALSSFDRSSGTGELFVCEPYYQVEEGLEKMSNFCEINMY